MSTETNSLGLFKYDTIENAEDFIRANDRRQRLINAGLFVVNRRYK